MTIEGSSDTELVFDGRNIEVNRALFNVYGALTVKDYSTIANNDNTSSSYEIGEGGGIYNDGILIIDGGVITGNSCNQRGGGIFNRGLMDMHGGTISSNYSGWNGGGIYSKQDLTIYDGIISENTCEGDGSAIYNESEMTMYGGTISNNFGYCFTNIGTVTMNDGFITGNEGDYIIYNTGVFNMTGNHK